MAIAFYPEGTAVLPKDGELRTLHKIADCACLGGGGPPIPGSDVLWIYWEADHADDNPPTDPTKSVMRRFLNGDPPVIWNPTLAAWL